MTGNIQRKILLADDSMTIQKVIKLTFNQGPHKIFDCKSEEELYNFLKKNVIDLLLLDFTLSQDNDGYSIAKNIKEKFPETKILMLYGTFDVVDEDRLTLANVDDYIIKPFESSRFLEKCTILMEGHSFDAPIEQEAKIEEIEEVEEVDLDWEMQEYRPETTEIELKAQEQTAPEENLNLEMQDWGVAVPPPAEDKVPEIPVEAEVPEIKEMTEEFEIDLTEVKIDSPEDLWASDPDLGDDIPYEIEVEEEKIELPAAPAPAPAMNTLEIQPSREEIQRQCQQIIEKIAWEIIPELAENIIQKELQKLRLSTENEIRAKVGLR